MKNGTFSTTIKEMWTQLTANIKSVNWFDFFKENYWVIFSIVIFIILILVCIIIVSINRKRMGELLSYTYDEEKEKLIKEIMEKYAIDNREKEEPKKVSLEDIELEDSDYETVLERLLDKKKKELYDAIILNKQQEAIIKRDTRIEALLMQLLDIKDNGINSDVAKEMLGENKVKDNKPEVIIPKIEINLPQVEKVEEIKEKIEEEEKPLEIPKIYSNPVNLNPINCEKIEVVQVAPGKKFGADNTNTTRSGVVYTDEEIRNLIKD